MSDSLRNAIRNTKTDTERAPLVSFNVGFLKQEGAGGIEFKLSAFQVWDAMPADRVPVKFYNYPESTFPPEVAAALIITNPAGEIAATVQEVRLDSETQISITLESSPTPGPYLMTIPQGMFQSESGEFNNPTSACFMWRP